MGPYVPSLYVPIGDASQVGSAQSALCVRAKANSQAALGQYQGSSSKASGANERTYVQNYRY